MHQFEEPASALEDLMALPGDTKAELIDGVIYMMAPAAATHSYTCGQLVAQISKASEDVSDALQLMSAWTYYDDANVFVHDIAAFSRKDLVNLPDKGPIEAKPVWVCEILSPSNWSNDTQRKRVVLEKHRVPYYWLVDPSEKNIQIFELLENSEHYQIIAAVENADGVMKLAPFLDLKLDLMKLFDY